MIPWIGNDDSSDDEDDEDEDVDESGLFGDGTIIETGVTSGADPSAWDPIGIERRPESPGNAPPGTPPNTQPPGD